MAFATAEQIHRYPRRFRWLFEVLPALLIVIATLHLGRNLLRYAWDTQGFNIVPAVRNTLFVRVVQWLDGAVNRRLVTTLPDLLPGLFWFAGALLAILFIRNFFPTIRTSGRGMLIEWSNSWLPLSWEQIRAVRVTEDLAGERYVLLLQTDAKGLTGWHRFYSLLYRFGLRRGIVVTSAISNFEPLVRTVLHELDQAARQMSRPRVSLDERATSPLFQLLLSPAGFFSRRSATDKQYVEQAVQASRGAQAGTVARIMATYPRRIRTLVIGLTAVLTLVALLRALNILRHWIAAAFPNAVGQLSFFQADPLPATVSVWWLPFSAVLVLAVMLPLLVVLRNMLPDVESLPQGLSVRYFNRWLLVPWNAITAVKSADLSKDNHVMLLQTTNRVLRPWHRVSSLLFDGSFGRGVLLTSALSTFDSITQQIVLEVSRNERQADADEGILQENAPAWMMHLLFKPSEAIERLVRYVRGLPETARLTYRGFVAAAGPMIWLAALPTAMLLVEWLINNGLPPAPGRLITALVFFVMCLLEWPIAAGLAQMLENNLEDDAHQARPFYLYPMVQLPRLLVMVAALVLLVFGVPLLPTLLWLGAAVWSFLLTAGLWEEMYGWSGPQLLVLGVVPAAYQFLTLVAWGALT